MLSVNISCHRLPHPFTGLTSLISGCFAFDCHMIDGFFSARDVFVRPSVCLSVCLSVYQSGTVGRACIVIIRCTLVQI